MPARPFVQSPASCGIQDWHTFFGGALGGWQHHAGHGLQRTLHIMQAHCLRPEPGARARRSCRSGCWAQCASAAWTWRQGGTCREAAARACGAAGRRPQLRAVEAARVRRHSMESSAAL